jgi:hypothetical protein
MSITETERMMQGRVGIDKSERIRSRSVNYRAAPQDQPGEPPKLNECGQLTAEEVAKRRSGSGKSSEVVLGDVTDEEKWIHASWAVTTQRGYHPDREYILCFV